MLIVADHASVESNNGKLNILGAFRQIIAPQFPARHHAMSLVIKLGGEIGDKPNPHTLSVSFTNKDGQELLKITGAFDMPRGEAGIQPEFNLVLEFRDIVLAQPDTYCFYVYVDDEDEPIDQTAIQITQAPPKSQE